MPPRCGDWLSVLQDHLREPLFHPEATARLHRLALSLPGDLLNVLEIRLAAEAAPIDLSVRVKEPAEARRLSELAFPPHLQAFLADFGRPEGPFSRLTSVWIELDLDAEPRGLPAPVVCAKLRPGSDPEWLAETLFPALHGSPLSPAQRRLIRFCLEAIPAPGYLLYAFSLGSRGESAVRLEIFGLEPASILAYVGRVAPSLLPWVCEPVRVFAGVERVHLSLDLGEEGIRPRAGIEGSFGGLPRREPRWRELFDRFEKRGWCSPREREAALAWPGYETFWTAPARWPVERAGAGGVCFRHLSHLKLVCRPGREPEPKLYLAFGYRSGRPS